MCRKRMRRDTRTCSFFLFLFLSVCGADPGLHQTFGVDVSHHQGRIDWDLFRRQQVEFAYIKATEGGDYRDSLFSHNMSAARGAGIAVGAYHFFTFCRSALDQARNFINQVSAVKGDLPPVVDVEFVGNCKVRLPVDSLHAELKRFIVRIQEVYGVDPVIYTTEEFYERYRMEAFGGYRFWIRNMRGAPECTEDWFVWQFRVGELEGCERGVDFNYLKVDLGKVGRVSGSVLEEVEK